VNDNADVTQRVGGLRKSFAHPFPRPIEALHVPHLDDLSRAAVSFDDAVGVRKRDAHGLLDEDVQALLEGVECHLSVCLRGRADHDRVELRPLEQPVVILVRGLEVVPALQRVADGGARVGDGD